MDIYPIIMENTQRINHLKDIVSLHLHLTSFLIT